MSEQLLKLLGSALVPIVVFAVFAVARRFIPIAESPASKFSSGDLSDRFKTAQWIIGVSMVSLALALAWSTHALRVSLNRYYSVSQGGPGPRLLPQTAIWWFFPGFVALAFSYELILQLWSILVGRREPALYDSWTSYKAGFDGRKMLRWMGLIIAVPIGLLTILALPMHATLGRDEILNCGYGFSPCRDYRYVDARRMTQVEGFRDRNGKLTRRAGIVIDFSDGRRWSSADWGNFSRSVDPDLEKFLTAKTGLPLEHATSESEMSNAPAR